MTVADSTRALVHPLAAPFRLDGSNGEAFVLIHGFTGNAAHFRPLGAQLANRGYTVNAPLLAGHARDPEAMRHISRADWIENTLDAIREVGDHRRVHLVGLSMGGLLAIVAAGADRVATVTTINAPVVFRDRRVRIAPIAVRLKPLVRWPEEPAPDIDEEVLPFWIHATECPTSAVAELYALSRQAVRSAEHVSVPSLVIQSRTDDTAHPKSGPRLRAALGGDSRLLWLEHSIHNSLFDRERHVIRDAVVELVGR
ncbi:MAG TPA: alpha/beta fold hydrolase [Acidimicrobiia bacterium]|nr:alpha/beta fold hydrolase [Acidimicrobiia bacterium]